jgi:hypothetical protein
MKFCYFVLNDQLNHSMILFASEGDILFFCKYAIVFYCRFIVFVAISHIIFAFFGLPMSSSDRSPIYTG